MRKGKEYEEEFAPQLELAEKKLEVYSKKREELWSKMEGGFNRKARVICPGEIKPGVEISIGPAFYNVDDFMQDVCFYFENDEIRMKSPALS